ncbi:MAG: flagellar operon protein [Lachnospiraceae bacterium]|jgi:flagellar operon protein|nr:flagellar operon protein [Lachnospiraceae bacterium]
MSINELQKLQYGPGKGSGGRTDTDQSAMSGPAFGEMLKAKTLANQGLNFSKHAAKRMGERGIPMDYQLLGDLEQAVEGARQKGAKDVAVIGRQGVFIVNVPNNVVVTTMSADDMKDRIFTNIDSAVIM